MPVTYTNRKDRKYYLCQGVTKTGKLRYHFSREQKGEPLDKIPEGYEITESVNGIVSLSKVRPKLLLEQEIANVKSAIQRHPQAKKYRLDTKPKEITIYEQVGPDMQEHMTMMSTELGIPTAITSGYIRRMEKERDVYTQYTPIMKFILSDRESRLFRAQRMCFLWDIDDWIDIEYDKTIEELARALVPTLGSDEFFELY